MSLECKLEILKEKEIIYDFSRTVENIIKVRCPDDVRNKIFNNCQENNKYILSRYYTETLLIAKKDDLIEYIRQEIGNNEKIYLQSDELWAFEAWLSKNSEFEVTWNGSLIIIINKEVRFKRIMAEKQKKEREMNLIDELF